METTLKTIELSIDPAVMADLESVCNAGGIVRDLELYRRVALVVLDQCCDLEAKHLSSTNSGTRRDHQCHPLPEEIASATRRGRAAFSAEFVRGRHTGRERNVLSS